MQRTVASKLISGLSASGASASVSGGSGITVNNGVVAVDNNVVATDAELATKLAGYVSTTDLTTQLATKASTTELATKVSASDNNLTFSGTNPSFSNNLQIANKVLIGNNSGFGIVCLPDHNNLTDYSFLFDNTATKMNKKKYWLRRMCHSPWQQQQNIGCGLGWRPYELCSVHHPNVCERKRFDSLAVSRAEQRNIPNDGWERHRLTSQFENYAGWHERRQKYNCIHCHEHCNNSDTHPIPKHLEIRHPSLVGRS